MKQLEFYHSIFQPEESNSTATQMVLSIENSGSTDETLLLAKDELEEKNKHLTTVLNAQKSNPYTDLLKNDDYFRDETHVGGRDVAQAMTHWVFDTEKQEAATRLVKIFERHGWSLQTYGYQKQSSATNSLIDEMSEPENQKDLATCDLTVWFGAEVKSQRKFETTFNSKAEHEGNKASAVKREAQVPVNEAITKLVTYVNSVILFKENDQAWNTIFNNLDGILKEATAVARSRRTIQSNKTESE
jgi:hypothetical protein